MKCPRSQGRHRRPPSTRPPIGHVGQIPAPLGPARPAPRPSAHIGRRTVRRQLCRTQRQMTRRDVQLPRTRGESDRKDGSVTGRQGRSLPSRGRRLPHADRAVVPARGQQRAVGRESQGGPLDGGVGDCQDDDPVLSARVPRGEAPLGVGGGGRLDGERDERPARPAVRRGRAVRTPQGQAGRTPAEDVRAPVGANSTELTPSPGRGRPRSAWKSQVTTPSAVLAASARLSGVKVNSSDRPSSRCVRAGGSVRTRRPLDDVPDTQWFTVVGAPAVYARPGTC